MGLTKPTPVSEKKAAASRRNAQQHSTGPRTEAGKERSRLNALQFGIYSTIRTRVAMIELGENPDEFDDVRDRLRTCYGYHEDPLIAAEVEELAWLLWRKQRLERSRDAMLVEAKRRADTEGRRHEREFSRETIDLEAAARVGLRRLKDSPPVFERTLNVLKIVQEAAQAGQIRADHLMHVRYLYGEEPAGTGASIKRLCEQLAHPEAAAEETPEKARQLLLTFVEMETLQVEAEYALFREDHIEPSMWARNARLAPDEEWTQLIREGYHLDRAIDRKVALLMKLRAELRKQQQWEREQEEAEAEAAGEWETSESEAAAPAAPESPAAASGSSPAPATAEASQATAEDTLVTAEATPAAVDSEPATADSSPAVEDQRDLRREGEAPSPRATPVEKRE